VIAEQVKKPGGNWVGEDGEKEYTWPDPGRRGYMRECE
jgi:hypothetical protein